MRRPLANALAIDLAGGLTDQVPPQAGSALLIEVLRRSGVIAAAERHLPAKKSAKGLRQGELGEAFIVLSALGGECLDDFGNRRRDRGLAALLGYDVPAASTARQWLERFHEAEAIAGRPEQGSFIPAESVGLAGLRAVVEHSVRTYGSAVKPGPMVTLDVDAPLVAASKQSALRTYEGVRGDQPLLVTWAETGLVVADEFRDGNVPASQRIKELVATGFAALPHRPADAPWQVSVRSDSAAYEQALLDHWHTRGWRFAVSADMSSALRKAIVARSPEVWTVGGQEASGVIRAWAEVASVPSRKTEQQAAPIYRYLAIRVLKNELAAGVYPSDKFGANAAWLRLQVLTLNLLEILKATALDEQYRRARPKRLRFAIFTQFGRVVRHARSQLLRLTTRALDTLLRPGLRRIRVAAWAGP
jgi:hypothetical protein